MLDAEAAAAVALASARSVNDGGAVPGLIRVDTEEARRLVWREPRELKGLIDLARRIQS
jgi:hypothetical protein